MDVAELNAWMDRHFTRSAFRLETLQTYEVASDGSDYRRYLDGEPTWTAERKQPWLDHLAAEAARGLDRYRVRIVTRPISDYTRYECEWGYVPNVAAGEDVHILDLGEQAMPSLGDAPLQDWWLVTDATSTVRVVVMRYGNGARFLGAEQVYDVEAFLSARQRLWRISQPFTEWWARHPELHRDQAAAPAR